MHTEICKIEERIENSSITLNFLVITFTIEISLLGLFILDTFGFNIPLFRQVVGFIFLTFIPGLLLIQILGMNRLSLDLVLLYALGFSLAVLMLVGLTINFLFPVIGISRPFTFEYIFISLIIITSFLSIIAYNKNSYRVSYGLSVSKLLCKQYVFLLLLPILSILGASIVNIYKNNIILMLIIVIVIFVISLISLNSFISVELYPFAILMITIALLYHNSLISASILGWDIHNEYYLANLVLTNAKWNQDVPSITNSMMSIVIIAPVYSEICNLNLNSIFKIIYPFFFSFLSIGLYRLFQKQTSEKIAFLACFFLISNFAFYTDLLGLARQQIGELYLALIVLTIVGLNLSKIAASISVVLFSIALVISYYGLSYLYLFSLISIFCFYYFFYYKNLSDIPRFVNYKYICLICILTLAWSVYASIFEVSPLNSVLKIGRLIFLTVRSDFLVPSSSGGLNLLVSSTSSPLHDLYKYIYILSNILISIGLISSFLQKDNMKFNKDFLAFSYINFLFCVAGILVPHFAAALNTSRLYQITLIFLAPFIIVGIYVLCNATSAILMIYCDFNLADYSLKISSLFVIIFFLFNVGFIFEITMDHPTSVSLSQNTIIRNGNLTDIKNLYINLAYLPIQNIYSVYWMKTFCNGSYDFYSDSFHQIHVLHSYGMVSNPQELTNKTIITGYSYIYLGYFNTIYRMMKASFKTNRYDYWNVSDLDSLKMIRNRIYSNGGSSIYLCSP